MAHPIHCEIRSSDADATLQFFGRLFGWKFNEVDGGMPGYTFVDTGDEAPVYTAVSPLQATHDQVLFFIGVDDVETRARAGRGARWPGRSARDQGTRRHVRGLRRSPGSRGGRRGQRLSPGRPGDWAGEVAAPAGGPPVHR